LGEGPEAFGDFIGCCFYENELFVVARRGVSNQALLELDRTGRGFDAGGG
jgi:hypothetical protein